MTSLVALPRKPNLCQRKAPFLYFPLRIGNELITVNVNINHYFAEEDDGQFEPIEDEVDQKRRFASESPVNKVMPIPEGTSFFCFAQDNK